MQHRKGRVLIRYIEERNFCLDVPPLERLGADNFFLYMIPSILNHERRRTNYEWKVVFIELFISCSAAPPLQERNGNC
jgi:hypothetical protein